MSRIFSKWYDFIMGPLEKGKFKTVRKDLLQRANGSVLEIGSGTGVNFPYYHSVTKVTAIEPSQHMIERSRKRREMSVVPIQIIQDNAERLPFDDDTFDTVVATLVLCTIPNPEAALQEMKRVCKPEGKILMFEHVKMNNVVLANLQEYLTPLWKKVCDGCCLNRDTLQMINENGLQIVHKKTFYNGLFIQVEVGITD
ncbi:class I SAM-dependent methyltransferase [Peribacillus psychrosaccharolyticus]|uniref:Class I SAM-dependent methyltransferase n=1 Tax=Peribacillus psychrosaccharolyticus TaxID=1407 RepID=A0A974NQK2_PERPY|nr:class I SAM-dependent methyltransferase [Peribacillus psychrosaccharolyticus]MEC2055079.1 class I SAM-dependent methyltransferase [Peribacillus psychrosaccharolyticus]MED3743869.1 class I SAM-dependent methyltransferase [Peribacillus psychrosaccharolyticus]QQT02011.1 class I SAM-dependent methyltransferase [Peribacillus psychrosaccharolyticus]